MAFKFCSYPWLGASQCQPREGLVLHPPALTTYSSASSGAQHPKYPLKAVCNVQPQEKPPLSAQREGREQLLPLPQSRLPGSRAPPQPAKAAGEIFHNGQPGAKNTPQVQFCPRARVRGSRPEPTSREELGLITSSHPNLLS